MPAAAYIVCAQSVSRDEMNNLVNLNAVIERMVIRIDSKQKKPQKKGAGPVLIPAPLQGIAVWSREPADTDKEFESEVILRTPDGEETVMASTTFGFSEGQNLQRIFLNFAGIPWMDSPGVLVVENRVRRAGNKRWKSQSYPILVDIAKT